MSAPDPLSLETFGWSTIEDSQHTWPTQRDQARKGNFATEPLRHNAPEQRPDNIINEEAIAVDAVPPAGIDLKEEGRLSRRASRKQRPGRSRSLLDEIAAEKGLTDRKPSGTISTRTEDIVPNKAPKRASKPTALRLSSERRQFMQSTVNELVDDEADAETSPALVRSPVSGSASSSPDPRTSLESIDSRLTCASPVSILSGSRSSLTPSPRPIIGVRTKSSVNERRTFRRTSSRVGSSSWSPASAFLARWNRDDAAPPAEPDEEGQEVGEGSGYIIGRQIGQGGFSIVKEAFTMENGERRVRAVKIIRKGIPSTTDEKNGKAQQELEHEVTIWRYLKHPRILPLLAVFDTSFATFCIMKYSTGGTLFDVVARYRRQASNHASDTAKVSTDNTKSPTISPNTRRTMPLAHAKHYIAQLASALRYMHHDVRIVHRDVKLDNCLITQPQRTRDSDSHAGTLNSAVEIFPALPSTNPQETDSPPGNLLLCDFGMADFISADERNEHSRGRQHAVGAPNEQNQKSHDNIGPGPYSANLNDEFEIAGSLPYAAPELLHAKGAIYSPAADIWALGVVSYALLAGELPFRGLDAQIASAVCEGCWDVGRLKGAVRRSLLVDRGDDDVGLGGVEVERAVELVEGCLRLDVEGRWDVGRVLSCLFLDGWGK